MTARRKVLEDIRDVVGVRMNPEEISFLDKLAERWNMGRSGAIRRVLADYERALGMIPNPEFVNQELPESPDEKVVSVTFRLEKYILDYIDEQASGNGMTRSHYIRGKLNPYTPGFDNFGEIAMEIWRNYGLWMSFSQKDGAIGLENKETGNRYAVGRINEDGTCIFHEPRKENPKTEEN